ncbi:hypothetical protein [Enemella evansiae]|uniref:hypothetical protein n=1 Tax=Enemella evansiae TaxID=2016499 RepID=UPI001E48C4ED|nr:hypothetical protein [Enemella evansiae]
MTQERYPVPLEPPRYSHPPVKLNSTRRISLYTLIDVIVAVVALGLTLWLAAVVLLRGFNWSWVTVLYLLVFWGLVAYLALPRLHQLFTTLYVPDYFIGRPGPGTGCSAIRSISPSTAPRPTSTRRCGPPAGRRPMRSPPARPGG